MTRFRRMLRLSLRSYARPLATSNTGHWLKRVVIWSIVVLYVVGLGGRVQTQAQTTGDSNANATAEPISEVQRLIRASVSNRDLESPEEIVEAAQVLLDVQLYSDVRQLLERFEALKLDDQQLIGLTQKTGSSFFSDVFLNANLQPEGRRIGGRALEGARRGLLAEANLSSLYQILGSNDISARSRALRQLRLAGEPAVAGLLNGFTQAGQVDQFPAMRTALQTLAPELPKPVVAGGLADDPQVRLEAIRALRNVRTQEALGTLYLAILTPNQNDLVHSTADEILRSRPEATLDIQEIETWFHRQTVNLLTLKSNYFTQQRAEPVWFWDKQKNLLQARASNVATNRAQTAARYAHGLYQSNPQVARNRQLYLLTQLELAKRLNGPNLPVNASSLSQRLELSAGEVNQLLPEALKLELYPAALACCEILKAMGDASVLTPLFGNYPALTHAILSGERGVQFAALDAIIQLDPHSPFAGSSHVVTLAVFLANKTGQPQALIGHQKREIAQSYASAVASSGLSGESATTGRELFAKATTNSDTEIILVSDTLASPAFGSLIQQLKSDWRTRQIPVALLYSDDFRGNRARVRMEKLGVTVIPFTTEAALVASSVDRMVDQVTPFRQDRAERIRQARVAIRWLAKIANNRKDYGFLNLSPHAETIRSLIYQPGFGKDVSDILAQLATPDSQRQLVNYASEISLPLEQRQHAVNAFKQASQRTGVLLTKDEILLQYDRYNASERLPQETQQVLGSLLDIIEGQH